MGVDNVSGALTQGYTVKIQDRGKKPNGITFELKDLFAKMEKENLIKDTGAKGLSAQEAQKMYAELVKIHKERNIGKLDAVNVNDEFEYSQADMLRLLNAAGYEVVEKAEDDTPVAVVSDDEENPSADPTIITTSAGQHIKKGEANGVTTYRPMTLNPETNKYEVAIGEGKFIAGENGEFYHTDDSIPDGVQIKQATVIGADGKPKPALTYTVEETQNGQTKSYTYFVEQQGGTAENPMYGKDPDNIAATVGNKLVNSQYLNNQIIQNVGVDPSELPKGVKPFPTLIDGDVCVMYKYDGQTLTAEQVKDMITPPEIKQTPVEQPAPATTETTPEVIQPQVNDDGYVENMAEVLASLSPDIAISQGEFGLTVELPNGKTADFGNSIEELEQACLFIQSNGEIGGETAEEIATTMFTQFNEFATLDQHAFDSIDEYDAELGEQMSITPEQMTKIHQSMNKDTRVLEAKQALPNIGHYGYEQMNNFVKGVLGKDCQTSDDFIEALAKYDEMPDAEKAKFSETLENIGLAHQMFNDTGTILGAYATRLLNWQDGETLEVEDKTYTKTTLPDGTKGFKIDENGITKYFKINMGDDCLLTPVGEEFDNERYQRMAEGGNVI